MKAFLKLILIILLTSSFTNAQFNILKKVKEKVEDKVEEKTDEAIDKGVDKAFESPEEENVQNEDLEANGNDKSNSLEAETSKPPSLEVYSKYDFIPGEQVIYFEDFNETEVGDFPADWDTDVSGEIVTINNYPGKWLKIVDGSAYMPLNDFHFPKDITVEFDVLALSPDDNNFGTLYITVFSKNDDFQIGGTVIGKGGMEMKLQQDYLEAYNYKDQEYGFQADKHTEVVNKNNGKLMKVSLWLQGQRARLYLNEEKVFDLPRLVPDELSYDGFRLFSYVDEDWDANLYISNLRIAQGAPDTRSKLLTEGKLVTRGIYFDSGSDVVKPESYGTLKEIAKVLSENKDVKVKIVGHTDSDGDEAMNLDLSKRRASSVKIALNEQFGIEAARMEFDGKGESEPVISNNTPEDKANNRRVEFIKL